MQHKKISTKVQGAQRKAQNISTNSAQNGTRARSPPLWHHHAHATLCRIRNHLYQHNESLINQCRRDWIALHYSNALKLHLSNKGIPLQHTSVEAGN